MTSPRASGPGAAADQVLPGAVLCPEQPIDETAEPIGLLDHRLGYRDPACGDLVKSGLRFLILAVCTFEVNASITHRSATGFREPERRIVRRSIQLVTQMSETTLLQPNPVDRRHEALSHLESNKSATAAREATMIGQRVTGRGSLLAHTPPPGGRWLSVKGRGRGRDRMRVREPCGLGERALDRQTAVAYPPGMSKQTPPSSHPVPSS